MNNNFAGNWPRSLPIETYCELYHDTVDAITYRVKTGHWQNGVHVIKPPGVKCRWVNIAEVEKWALNYQKAS